jgi:nucleotidyltransferase/DNA polymerase involved in DNA repair
MNNMSLQLNLRLADQDQVRRTWAFAVSPTKTANSKRRRLANVTDCVITACSKEARALGIRAGMRYEDAKSLIPDIKILVIGGLQ